MKSNDYPQLVVQEMGDEGDFSQGILDILYATEVEEDFHDDFLKDDADTPQKKLIQTLQCNG